MSRNLSLGRIFGGAAGLGAFVLAMAVLDHYSTPPSQGPAPESGLCRLFTRSIPAGTELTVVGWSGPPAAAVAAGNLAKITGVAVEPLPAGAEAPDFLQLKSSGLRVARSSGDAKPVGGGIDKALTIPAGALGRGDLEALAGSLGLLQVRDEKETLYRLTASGDRSPVEALLRAGAKAGLVTVEIAKGSHLSFEDFDPSASTATIVVREAEKATEADKTVFRLENLRDLAFTLANSTTLDLEPSELAGGSLRVVDAPRAVGLTAVRLALTHRTAPFGKAVIRGCLLARGGEDAPWAKTPAAGTLPDIRVLTGEAGKAEISFMLPSLDEAGTPDTATSLLNMAFGDRPNTWIRVMAADETGIIYAGETRYFVDDRWAAFWIGIAAAAFAYLLPFLFLWRSGRLKESPNFALSPLNLVRGLNGTASLSNLQILFWTVVVFGLLAYVFVGTGTLVTFDTSIMWLLGIAGAGSLSAKFVAATKQDAQAIAAAAGRPAMPRTTAWDLIAAGDRIDLAKLQMLIFTFLTGLYVVTTVWSQFAFPEVPTQMLTLMGISNGVYVLSKVPEENLVVKLATLRLHHEALGEEIAAAEARKAEIEKTAEKDRDDAQKAALAKLEEEIKALTASQTGTAAEIAKVEKAVKAAAAAKAAAGNA